MQKDFTIEAEVRLFAHWRTPATTEEKEAVNDRLGVIATSPNAETQYNPYEGKWEYTQPGTSPEYNPYSGEWEFEQ